MNRILHLINSSDVKRGGAQRILRNIIDVQGYEHSVFCIDQPDSADHYVGGKLWFLKFWFFLSKVNPKIVLVHTRKFIPLAWLARFFFKINVVFVCHSQFPKYNGIVKVFELDRYIAISNAVKDSLENFVPSGKISVIYNGVSCRNSGVQLPTKSSVSSSNKIKIGFVGTLNLTKGLDVLVEAFKLLSARQSVEFELFIVGDGEMRDDVLRQIKTHNLSIHLLGYQKDPFLILDDVDVVIIPSRQEGFCLVLVESLISGKIVICSDIPPLREIAGQYSSVVFFRSGDCLDLAEKIALNVNARNDIGGSELQRISLCAAHRFSTENMKDQYSKFFSSF